MGGTIAGEYYCEQTGGEFSCTVGYICDIPKKGCRSSVALGSILLISIIVLAGFSLRKKET